MMKRCSSMNRMAVICSFLVAASGCARLPSDATQGDRRAAEDDIREVAIRHTISTNNSRIYFLSFEGEDPSPEFLARFSRGDQKLTVKPRSASTTKGQLGTVVDKETGQWGESISIGKIHWLEETSVNVRVRTYQDGKAG